MASDFIASTLSGSIFGAALTAAGVYLPNVILDQMAFKEFHMMKVFLTASASSAIIFALYPNRGECKPRPASNLGWFGPYDGNIIGGAMIGAGMTLTGACPGTMLIQAGTGVPSALPVLLGGIAGGVVYKGVESNLKTEAEGQKIQEKNTLTVPTKFKVDYNASLLAYEALLLSGILVFSKLQATPPYLLNPVIGGLAIGSAQFASVLLRNSPLGVSSAFEDMGNWVWWIVERIKTGKKNAKTPKPSVNLVQFAVSIMAGSYILTKLRPEYALATDQAKISPTVGFLGGLVMIVGARIAGGCTSGHGISGMSMLSVSSIVSVASMFGAGMGLGTILYR